MAKEHPLIVIRRIISVAIHDQLELAAEAQSIGYATNLSAPVAQAMAEGANREASRLTARLIWIQEKIEEQDID